MLNNFLEMYFDNKYNTIKMTHGNENANYQVNVNNKKYFLRIYQPKKDFKRAENDILKELEYTEIFFKKGFPVARVLKNKKGKKLSKSKGQYGALFEFLEGFHVYGNLKKNQFEAVGNLMGNVHKTTEKENLVCSKTWKEGNFWKHIWSVAEKNRELLEKEEIQLLENTKRFEGLLNDIPQYFIHADFHFGNILFDENFQITGLLDFDDYRGGHLIEDAVRFFIADLAYVNRKLYKLKKDFVVAFWTNYLKTRHIKAEEKSLISIYIDLHYVSQVIRIKKNDTHRLESFKKDFYEFKSYCNTMNILI